jgi:hypothetical protein
MNVIDRVFRRVYGQLCWGSHYDPLVNLSLSFGQPSLEIVMEPRKSRARSEAVKRLAARRLVSVKGRWWLWVYQAYWSISSKGERLASSSSSVCRKKQAAALLEGERLVRVDVNPQSGASRFTFDLGGELVVRRMSRDSTDELWLLYEPNRYVLSVRGDGTYDHEPGSGLDKRPGVSQRELPH